jgi:hypothetical protein
MKKPPIDAPVHTKTLVEQKTDFTAEGSPPPGKVVGSVPPITPDMAAPASDKKRPPIERDAARGTAEKGTTPPKAKRPARPSKYG